MREGGKACKPEVRYAALIQALLSPKEARGGLGGARDLIELGIVV